MNFKIGVDGGGTKTECILVDDSGAIVARHLAPGCNPSIVGAAEAAGIVKTALENLVAGVGGRPDAAGRPRVTATLICAAGNRVFWQEFAAGLAGFGRVVTTDDSLPILELATGGKPGLVLHAGTGSFIAACDDSRAAFYAGGLGWRFGDPGSGYELGRLAIARALLEMQGWREPSGIGRLVRESVGLSETAAVVRYYYDDPAPNPKIAGLTPGILRLAAENDPAATAIAIDSASALLDLAVSVAKQLFPRGPLAELPAGLSGAILTHPVVLPALRARAPFPLKAVTETPIEGVRRMLLREDGGN